MMNLTAAKDVANLAWSELMNLAEIGPHGMPYELREALKAETSRKQGGPAMPLHLAKARLVESAISGAHRRTRNLGDAMDAAETLARMAVQRETNTGMGTSAARQARKIKAIRKAMGYTY